MNVNMMLKKQGEIHTFKTVVTTITDAFHGTISNVESTYLCYAVVIPARAYDIHSNLFYRPETTGNEFFGIVSIIIDADDYAHINENDFLIDGTKRYKIIAAEFWDKAQGNLVVLEGHYESG